MKPSLLLFLLFVTISFSQTIEIKYYENIIPKNKEEVKTWPKNLQIVYKHNFFSHTLLTNGKTSFYKSDSILTKKILDEETVKTIEINKNGDTLNNIIKSSGFDFRSNEKLFYKDFKKNKIYIEQFFKEKIKIQDSLPILSWEILNEDTEVILGYTCKKAKAIDFGKIIYAWFTEELPIADGPSKYASLPGLILKIQMNTKEIIAYEVSLKKDDTPIPSPLIIGKVMNYKELKEYIDRQNRGF